MASKYQSGKPALLKKMNRRLILELVFKHKEISRSALAKKTGLALPSVMRLVDELISQKVLVDIGKGDSSGGRKPNLISLNKEFKYLIGVEIAVKTTIILTDMLGQIIDSWASEELPDSTPDQILFQVKDQVLSLLEKHAIEESQVGGIGIGTPGTNFKYVKDIPYSILKGWENMDVKAWFENQMDFRVHVDNVARTRTLAELWFGHGKNYDDFIYVFVDQGVGCGIVHENTIYEGFNGVAGEFGHHVIDYNGRSCYCGSRGCLEMYVSAGSIIKLFQAEGTMATSYTEILESDVSYKKALLSQVGHILGVGVSNLINIHNPKAIILGGIVATSDDVFNGAIESVGKNVFSNYSSNTPVLRGSVEVEGIGSIALVIHHLLENLDLLV
ncbi:ROK family transcriptional regulator [Acidaminobacter sp. JC074]|uniref:ROK family transcriptional regulator n=1 Tax=Acidaminobacter sp. JC074 TaxID=2530199 RepID=UPI001F0DAA96|nr:ROK family transcriptional regulator [Acidaminobacter sp. JC074]MCH4888062.1 ROK family transcriptional regulator [Acidaminobacter sp. JC074]